MADTGTLATLLQKINEVCQNFVFQGYQNLVTAFTPAVVALITLSFILFGYALLQGWVSFSLKEISKRLLTIGFILSFALNWGNFSRYIYVLFTDVPNEIIAHLIPLIPNGDGNQNTITALQQTFDTGLYYFKATWEQGSFPNIIPFICALLMFFLLIIWIGFALIELIFAKFGLAIYLVLAPVIIPLFLFQYTKSLVFDGWLKHLVILAFVPIFVTSALTLGMTLLTSFDLQMHIDSLNFLNISLYALSLFICIGLIRKAAYMAGALAHGFVTHGSEAAMHALTRTAQFTPHAWRATKSSYQWIKSKF